MRKQQVIFILDEAYSGDLFALSRQQHVWICESENNTPLIKAIRDKEDQGYSQECGVTSFPISNSRLEVFYSHLATINEHHAGDGEELAAWERITVFGIDPNEVDDTRVSNELDCKCKVTVENDSKMIIHRLAT